MQHWPYFNLIIRHTKYFLHNKIRLLFIDTATCTSCKVTNYVVKQSLICFISFSVDSGHDNLPRATASSAGDRAVQRTRDPHRQRLYRVPDRPSRVPGSGWDRVRDELPCDAVCRLHATGNTRGQGGRQVLHLSTLQERATCARQELRPIPWLPFKVRTPIQKLSATCVPSFNSGSNFW